MNTVAGIGETYTPGVIGDGISDIPVSECRLFSRGDIGLDGKGVRPSCDQSQCLVPYESLPRHHSTKREQSPYINLVNNNGNCLCLSILLIRVRIKIIWICEGARQLSLLVCHCACVSANANLVRINNKMHT